MDSNIRIALILILVIGVGVVGINIALTSLETPTDAAPATGTQTQDRSVRATNPAPELVGIAHYLNTTPKELEDKIKNSVVLYDIWTYSCINCIRTLPYITSWDEKYSEDGLLVIGIHSPEFEFEKVRSNVEQAIQKHNINYPVVMDNDMETWKAFGNRYWPHKYIADHEGNIKYHKIGEGDYENTERIIQTLLSERADALGINNDTGTSSVVDIQEYQNEGFTSELYFGYELARGNQIGNPEGIRPGSTVEYTIPNTINENQFYLDGTWENLEGSMKLVSESGSIKLSYHAKQVNIVAGTSLPANIEVYLDDMPISSPYGGFDVLGGNTLVDSHKLYNIVTSPNSERHTLELRILKPGFEIFTFTFG